jgi:hypothetical protein
VWLRNGTAFRADTRALYVSEGLSGKSIEVILGRRVFHAEYRVCVGFSVDVRVPEVVAR